MATPSTFNLKHKDTLPKLTVTLKNPDDSTYAVAGYNSLKAYVKTVAGNTLTLTLTTSTGTENELVYAWSSTDWGTSALTVGEHDLEFEVLDSNNDRLTFPNDCMDILKVHADLSST